MKCYVAIAAQVLVLRGELKNLMHVITEAAHGRHDSPPPLSLHVFNVHHEPEQESGALRFTLTHSTVVVLTKTSHKINPLARALTLQHWTVSVQPTTATKRPFQKDVPVDIGWQRWRYVIMWWKNETHSCSRLQIIRVCGPQAAAASLWILIQYVVWGVVEVQDGEPKLSPNPFADKPREGKRDDYMHGFSHGSPNLIFCSAF